MADCSTRQEQNDRKISSPFKEEKCSKWRLKVIREENQVE